MVTHAVVNWWEVHSVGKYFWRWPFVSIFSAHLGKGTVTVVTFSFFGRW